MEQSGDNRATKFLIQRIDVQRANAAAMMGTIPEFDFHQLFKLERFSCIIYCLLYYRVTRDSVHTFIQ